MSFNDEKAALNITTGEQSGASIMIQLGREYSVGVNLDHDIVLRSAVEDYSSLRIVADNDGVEIRDSVSSTTMRKEYSEEIEFGSITFRVERPDGLSQLNPRPFVPQRSKWSAVSLLRAGGLSVIGFVVLAFALMQVGTHGTPTVKTDSLESRLIAANLPQLHVDRSRSALIVIKGYVQSREEAIRLDEFVGLQPEPLVNQVYVDEEIKDQILDVLRITGVPGSIESLGGGAFIANTQWKEEEKLDQLQGLIERDVPSVLSFTVNNVLPETKQPDVIAQMDTTQLDAGKRVVMVNSDSPAYVVTEDQSRYFVGSFLPGGYRIAAITDGRVMVERKGVKTELKF